MANISPTVMLSVCEYIKLREEASMNCIQETAGGLPCPASSVVLQIDHDNLWVEVVPSNKANALPTKDVFLLWLQLLSLPVIIMMHTDSLWNLNLSAESKNWLNDRASVQSPYTTSLPVSHWDLFCVRWHAARDYSCTNSRQPGVTVITWRLFK